MKASDLIVRCLEEEHIEYVFGVPGEKRADFMLSLDESEGIRFVLTRREQGAAFMAEIYGRLTGNPAVCLAASRRASQRFCAPAVRALPRHMAIIGRYFRRLFSDRA